MEASGSVLVPHSYVSTIHPKELRSAKNSVPATEESMMAHFTDAVAETYQDIVSVCALLFVSFKNSLLTVK
jgi:hypothetical protein